MVVCIVFTFSPTYMKGDTFRILPLNNSYSFQKLVIEIPARNYFFKILPVVQFLVTFMT